MRIRLLTTSCLLLSALSSFGADQPLNAVEPGGVDPAKDAAAGNTAFAFELYSELSAKRGNLFFSPYSISTALGMTWAGARGETAEEMAKVLHFGSDVHAGLAALNRQLVGKRPGYQLSVANRLFVQNGYKLLAPFTTLVKEQYGAPVEQVDFAAEATRLHVNQWVEDQTNQRIKDLIPVGLFNAATHLALINAVYFKGTWAIEFDKKATTTQPFFGRKETPVQLMFRHFDDTAGVRYREADGVQVLELPYLGGEVTMVVLLPTKRDGLAALERDLDAAKFHRLIKSLRPSEAKVWLPRFGVTQRVDLSDTLMSMGMPKAFADEADFSGMTSSRDLMIGAVIHKAFIEVNEEGTEAAAATAVVMSRSSRVEPPTPKFRADHPFLFALRDAKSGSVLFLGRLEEP